MTDILASPLTFASATPAENAYTPFEELSDDDLEQVVGGLARLWSAVAPPPVPPATATMVTIALATATVQRMSA